jgi:hypothetical protein
VPVRPNPAPTTSSKALLPGLFRMPRSCRGRGRSRPLCRPRSRARPPKLDRTRCGAWRARSRPLAGCARRDGSSSQRCRSRANATSASTRQCTMRMCARPRSGSNPGRHNRLWNAASATTVTPAFNSRSRAPKNVGSVRMLNASPGPATNPGVACTMPSLISSRQIAGQPTARAIACARVVLPVPGGPETTTSVGRRVTLHSYSQVRH